MEVATGEADLFASVEAWQRETKQLGQVATPEPIAALMAKWVMSVRPRTVLDPAAGLGVSRAKETGDIVSILARLAGADRALLLALCKPV